MSSAVGLPFEKPAMTRQLNAQNSTLWNVCTTDHFPDWLVASSVLQVVLATLALTANGLLLVPLFGTQIVHINLRLLLANVSSASILCCLYTISKYLSVLVFYWLPTCQAKIRKLTCLWLESPNSLSSQIIASSLLCIGIERILASRYFKHYYKQGAKLGISLVVAQWGLAIAIRFASSAFFEYPLSIELVQLHHCQYRIIAPLDVILCATVIYLFGEVAALVLYGIIIRWNRFQLVRFSMNRAVLTLEQRTQLHRNIRDAEMLLVTFTIHGLLCFILLATSIYAYVQGRTETTWIIAEYGSVLSISYMIFHPGLCIRYHEPLRDHFNNVFRRPSSTASSSQRLSYSSGKASTKYSGRRDTEVHFEVLQNSWEKGYHSSVRRKSEVSNLKPFVKKP